MVLEVDLSSLDQFFFLILTQSNKITTPKMMWFEMSKHINDQFKLKKIKLLDEILRMH